MVKELTEELGNINVFGYMDLEMQSIFSDMQFQLC